MRQQGLRAYTMRTITTLAELKRELAQVVAVTPSYLSQLLGELEREGVLRRENGWIVIEGTGSR